MPSYLAERNAMLRAADRAGKSLLRDFARLATLAVSEKGPSDFVSSADLDAQAALCAELSSAFPGYGFLLEEEHPTAKAAHDARFIADPLDGTTNFLHGIPHFAVSLALEVEGEIVVGVVLNPVSGELFWAEKNAGAWLGEERLSVSTTSAVARAIVGTGIPHLGRPGHERFLRALARFMPEVAAIRRLGSAALDLVYVAAGRYDVFWEIGLSPWDIAAGQLIVQEAGGIVTLCNGEPLRLDGPDILAANGDALHRAALRWLDNG